MGQSTLKDIFGAYRVDAKSIFKNKDVLTEKFLPTTILHRDEQIRQLGRIVAPAIRGEKISNTFVFGTVGTGKTLTVRYVAGELEKENPAEIRVLYVNCKMKRVSDTEYRLLAELTRTLGGTVPATGLPTDHVYRIFFELLDKKKQNIILILDEIDNIIKKIGDDILYSLLRVNQELTHSKLSLIGISNDITFTDNIDTRIKSSLSEEDVIFPPYNAAQLQDILLERAALAFADDVLDKGVIAKAAALAAQEHGDARKALDLIRVAGEVVERSGSQRVTIPHIDCAVERLDTDRTTELVRNQPKQSLAVLASIIKLKESQEGNVQTGDVYAYYERTAPTRGLKLLTPRRVSDLINELDMLGIIRTKVVSKGRYGRTREIEVLPANPVLMRIKKILEENYLFDTLNRYG